MLHLEEEVIFAADPARSVVPHLAVVIGEDLQRVKRGSALVAQDLEIPHILFDVRGER